MFRHDFVKSEDDLRNFRKRKLVIMSLIYILEDDKNIQEIESYAIKGNGYDVRAFDDAEAFDKGMQEMKPDLLLLDIMLPGEDGLSVLKRLRSNHDTKELPVKIGRASCRERV